MPYIIKGCFVYIRRISSTNNLIFTRYFFLLFIVTYSDISLYENSILNEGNSWVHNERDSDRNKVRFLLECVLAIHIKLNGKQMKLTIQTRLCVCHYILVVLSSKQSFLNVGDVAFT